MTNLVPRNVNGSAHGIAYRAPMNPVAHNTTKVAGINLLISCMLMGRRALVKFFLMRSL
jgi:hypothetical protein